MARVRVPFEDTAANGVRPGSPDGADPTTTHFTPNCNFVRDERNEKKKRSGEEDI